MRPEDFWAIEPEYQKRYDDKVAIGAEVASRSKIAIAAIARDAMPHLGNTLALVDELASKFRSASFYCFENDSTDGTDRVLDDFAIRQWVTVEHATLNRPDYRGFEAGRTHALAEYRNRCRDWVEASAKDANYVAVLDLDPHGGFSIDGALNSVGWLCDLACDSGPKSIPGAMASVSLLVGHMDGETRLAQYDAWAARLNFWEDRRDKPGGMLWFHTLFPPTGSQPIPMNSAFGGLCIYTKDAYLAGRYVGGDCEHVAFHRAMREAGHQLYLNPGSRYAAILNAEAQTIT